MKMPDVYLSGRFDATTEIERAWLKKSGARHRCFSFAFIDPKSMYYNTRVAQALKVCEDEKVNIMLDSGAASLHSIQAASARRGKIADVKAALSIEELQAAMYKRYIKLCQKDKKKWAFYVTLDFVKKQPIIYEMQKQFLKDKLNPMPVYHGDSPLDWLLKYKDLGHTYIGIGGLSHHKSFKNKRFFYDRLFNYGAKHGFEFHGLAVTSLSIMTFYPWKSTDSSNWSRSASYGMLAFPDYDRNIIYNVHISEKRSASDVSYNKMTPKQRSYIKKIIEDRGFDLKLLRTNVAARHDWNGYVFSHLDKLGIEFKHSDKSSKWEALL